MQIKMQQQTTVIPNSGAHTQNMYNPSGVQVITTSAPGPGGVPQPAQPQQQVVYVQAAPAFRPLATGPTLYKVRRPSPNTKHNFLTE